MTMFKYRSYSTCTFILWKQHGRGVQITILSQEVRKQMHKREDIVRVDGGLAVLRTKRKVGYLSISVIWLGWFAIFVRIAPREKHIEHVIPEICGEAPA